MTYKYFFGSDKRSVPYLDFLSREINELVVITTKPKISGRGNKLRTNPVEDFCLKNDINFKYFDESEKYSDIFISTRGVGLIQGLVIKDDIKITSLDIVKSALEEKLLLVSAGVKVLRIVPPLTITKKEINELLSRLDKCLMKLS